MLVTLIHLSDKAYHFIYNRSIRMCVDMVIRDSKGFLFLTLRNIHPYKDLWHLPGGGVKFKETVAQAANRIALREFGSEVKIIRQIGLCETMIDDLTEDDLRHSNSIVVEVEILSGVPKITSESADICYFGTLPDKMHPYHRAFIQEHKLL